MAITPDPPYPKSAGDPIRSADWNQAVDEVIRLDDAKLNRAGDRVSGNLVVDGDLTVGVVTAQTKFHVSGGQWDVSTTEGDMKIGNATHRLKIGVATGGGGAGDVRLRAEGGTNRLMLGGGTNDTLTVQNDRVGIGKIDPANTLDVNGNATFRGTLSVPKTDGGFATFTNETFVAGEPPNLKLSMATQSPLFFPGQPPLTYEFSIGHIFRPLIIGGSPSFNKKFSINQDGTLFVAGGKGGYVFDHFVNRTGDTLSLGDVVVIGRSDEVHFSGTDSNVPIPEVDLTDRAYDTRVCGIVARVVTEADLPFVEPDMEALAAAVAKAETAAKKSKSEAAAADASLQQLLANPLRQFAAPVTAAFDKTQVEDQQMGHMVTLGAFAHCKVDADIAPIAPGDLLTTSPTKGHAQKVLEPQKAIGAIIGKALAGRESGRGTIPILVMLQ